MNIEIAKTIELLEATFSEVEERRARERLSKAQSEAFVFVRPAKVRDLVYQRLELYKDHEARRFAKSFSTKADKVDRYVDSVVDKVIEFFRAYDLYRKPVPRFVVELLIDHYFEVAKAYRRTYVATKSFSKKKRVRKATLDISVEQFVQRLRLERLFLGLGHEGLGLKAQDRESRPWGRPRPPMTIT